MIDAARKPQPCVDGLFESDNIQLLVVHCSDTPDDESLRARDIQAMHLGFGWDGIGYHRVIGHHRGLVTLCADHVSSRPFSVRSAHSDVLRTRTY